MCIFQGESEYIYYKLDKLCFIRREEQERINSVLLKRLNVITNAK